MNNDTFFLYDDSETTKVRYVSFVKNHRHDLLVIPTDRYYGKMIIVNLQSNRTAIIGDDDLKEEGYLEYAFKISEEEAEELRHFLETLDSNVIPPSD
ncbi:MAG TPA: DUF3055 domain-containing protein [Bacillota bacterium]|nr:DUF3055 domain-containing protein [Bacillota bacterium]